MWKAITNLFTTVENPYHNQIEEYAINNGRLHPWIVARLQEYFIDFDLNNVRIEVVPHMESALSTSVWVFFDTIRIVVGHLNYHYEIKAHIDEHGIMRFRSNKALDLSTPTGLAIIAHEIRHVQQFQTAPISTSLKYLIGLLKSWKRRHIYLHDLVEPEQDAISFQTWVQQTLEKLPIQTWDYPKQCRFDTTEGASNV